MNAATRCKPAVSVVMAVYNGERFLSAALGSLVRQSLRDCEVVVVNDGSTDRTSEIISRYQAEYANVRVLEQENRGLCASLNRGVENAAGALIARMDADDESFADRLERQLSFINSNAKVAVVGGATVIIDAVGHTVGVQRYPESHRSIDSALLRGECPLCHPAVVFRKRLFERVGGYRPSVTDAEDYDLWLRMAEVGRLANLPDPVLRYRRHPGQVSIGKFRQQALSTLIARAGATQRRRGMADPTPTEGAISTEIRRQLEITEADEAAVLSRAYLTAIRSMCDAKEAGIAWAMLQELRGSAHWLLATRALASDSHLLEARLHRREGRLVRALACIGQGIALKPTVLGRPVKHWLRRLSDSGAALPPEGREREKRISGGSGSD